MRVRSAVVGLCLSVGLCWASVSLSRGVVFWLPPGSRVHSWSGVWRVDFPVEEGTTLREVFLLVREGEAPPLDVELVRFGGKSFRFFREEEGAAGSFYESLSYSLPLSDGKWVTLSFVIHTVNPGVFTFPPPPYDRRELLDLIEVILERVRTVSGFPSDREGVRFRQ